MQTVEELIKRLQTLDPKAVIVQSSWIHEDVKELVYSLEEEDDILPMNDTQAMVIANSVFNSIRSQYAKDSTVLSDMQVRDLIWDHPIVQELRGK